MTNIIVKMNYTLVVQICQEGMKKSGRKSELLSLPLGMPRLSGFRPNRLHSHEGEKRAFNHHRAAAHGLERQRHAERAHELQRQQDNQHNHRHNEQRRERLLAP